MSQSTQRGRSSLGFRRHLPGGGDKEFWSHSQDGLPTTRTCWSGLASIPDSEGLVPVCPWEGFSDKPNPAWVPLASTALMWAPLNVGEAAPQVTAPLRENVLSLQVALTYFLGPFSVFAPHGSLCSPGRSINVCRLNQSQKVHQTELAPNGARKHGSVGLWGSQREW